MKKLTLVLVAIAGLALTGCDNWRAKNIGGNANVNLPAGQKLVGVTWEQHNLWYLTRPMRTNEVAETSVLHEQSNLGILQGTVTFIERN